MTRLIDSLINLLARIPHAVPAVIGRLAIGLTFWYMARALVTGWNVFSVNGRTLDMFRGSYRLPYVMPEIAALVWQVSEHVFAALLILGLATRFAGLGLLILVILLQAFIHPDAYVLHGTWAAVLLMLIKYGPGPLSLDYLIYRR
jgi:putative oxidoreductase